MTPRRRWERSRECTQRSRTRYSVEYRPQSTRRAPALAFPRRNAQGKDSAAQQAHSAALAHHQASKPSCSRRLQMVAARGARSRTSRASPSCRCERSISSSPPLLSLCRRRLLLLFALHRHPGIYTCASPLTAAARSPPYVVTLAGARAAGERALWPLQWRQRPRRARALCSTVSDQQPGQSPAVHRLRHLAQWRGGAPAQLERLSSERPAADDPAVEQRPSGAARA